MRIVHIVMSMMYGGSERLATDLAYSMQNAGNEVYIIALSKKDPAKGYDKTDKGKKLTTIFIDKKRGFDLKAISEINTLLTRINPDVVHTHIDSAIYVMMWELFHKRVVKVHTVHNQAEKEFGFIKRKIMKFGFATIKITPVAISEQIQKSISSEYRKSEKDIPVILNGIDVKKFQNNRREQNHNRELQIIHVGRFFEQKNHIFMLKAIKELVNRNVDFHITFVGEGPLFTEIVENAKEMEILKYITFAGTTDLVEEYYSNADIFVLPSIFEGLPLSLLEAYAAGLPVVCCDVGGVSDICKDGLNGKLIAVNDLEAFVNAIIEMCDSSVRKKYSDYNLEFIKKYDVDTVAEKYLELYSSLSNKRR